MLRVTCEHLDARLPSEHAGAKEYRCTHSTLISVHDLRQHEVAWARPVRVVRLAPMRSLDLRGRMRSLGVNLSLWRTTDQPGISEDVTCASGTPTARKSWKARFWTIAVAAVQTTVRGLGVTAYGMASAAVASRAVFAVFLAIFLSRGRKETVLIVPAKVSRKCKRKCFAIPLFSSNR